MRNINDIRGILSESTSTTIPAPAGSVSLNYIDISDPFDPSVAVKGHYSVKMSTARKDIAMRLKQLADSLARGTNGFTDVYDTINGQKGDAFNLVLTAYMEAEKALAVPSNKAKLALAKKRKRGGA